MTVAKLQTGFYRLIAEPLYKEWHRFLASSLSSRLLANLYTNQAAWEQEVLQQELPAPEHQQPPLPQPTAKFTRRLSLPASDPLHRIFDQMIQPDQDMPRSSSHLRRNFSLSDRRRSSLLRGLHPRVSLKSVRGRVTRPASVCVDQEQPGLGRALQARQNRENSMEVQEQGSTKSLHASRPDLFQEKQEIGEKENTCHHSSYERLTRRRGSAPSNLVVGEVLRLPLSSSTAPQVLRHNHSLSASNRRGSLPTDLLQDSLPKQLRNRMIQSCSGSKRPGLLRRRSMGPELLNLGSQQVIKERQLVQKYLNRPF